MTMKRRFLVSVIVTAALGLISAQTGSSIEVLQLRPNFWMIAGAGGNVGVQVGVDGVVVVDSGSTSTAPAILAEITGSPARNPSEHRIRMMTLVRPKDGFHWGGKPGEVVD
jgi:hypothetical protein